MSSLLAEVISSAEKVEMQEIKTKVPELQTMMRNCKENILKYVDDTYAKMSHFPQQNADLLYKARKAHVEMDELKQTIEGLKKNDLVQASAEIKNLEEELKMVQLEVQLVLPLCEINEDLLAFDGFLVTKSYVKCMELVKKMLAMINSVPDNECLDALIELNSIIWTKREQLFGELHDVFTDSVITTSDDNKIVLKIKQNNTELEEALTALYIENNSKIYLLQKFVIFLRDEVLIALIDYVTQINIQNDMSFNILEIEKKAKKPDTYNNVFKRIECFTQFLFEHFNLELDSNTTTTSYIGTNLRDHLSELLINNCLERTIPSTMEGLEEYNVVIKDTEQLQKTLVKYNIFDENTMSIQDYANNINVLFINKKCLEYSKLAESIMKKDLHDMTEVGVPYDPNNPSGYDPASFHQCSVSKSVIELCTLCEKIIERAIDSSEVFCGPLVCTAQNIVYKYGSFVSEYHKRLLQTIPQQIALFYNNCDYLSHESSIWNSKYGEQLRSTLNLSKIFDNMKLMTIATSSFTTYVESQIAQINEIMKDAGLTGKSLSKLEPVTEKCVRQCLRQQELLKTVWSKVLSYTEYNRTLGVIFSSLCEFIVNAVVKFEDIPSDVAEQLVEIIKIILNRGPKLFTDPNEISLYVETWHRLNELNFVLGASLIGITDRWADGKGVLALYFKTAEMRQLIRALFQNTDKRAAVLLKFQDKYSDNV